MDDKAGCSGVLLNDRILVTTGMREVIVSCNVFMPVPRSRHPKKRRDGHNKP
jgi:hypothetical protein